MYPKTPDESCSTHTPHIFSQYLCCVQLIACSRMDQKQQMKLVQDAAAADASAPASSRPPSAGSKSSSLCPMYPHMYAVELKRLAWLLDMITSAQKCFHKDESDLMQKRHERLSESQKQRIYEADSRRAASAAEKKKADWINIQIGATNPPTALFRSVPTRPSLKYICCCSSALGLIVGII